jgi:hypothetical protein
MAEQSLQIKRNKKIFGTKEEAVNHLQRIVDKLDDGEIVLCRYFNDKTIQTLVGFATKYEDNQKQSVNAIAYLDSLVDLKENFSFGNGFVKDENDIVNLNIGDGLTFDDNNKLKVNSTSGLTTNADGAVYVNCGDGLTFDDNKKLKVVLGQGLEIQNNQINVVLGQGLEIQNNQINVQVNDSVTNFLHVDNNGMKVVDMNADCTKLQREIRVAGLNGTKLGAGNYKDDDVIAVGTDIYTILQNILCKELYPTAVRSTQGKISSSIAAPTISAATTTLLEVGDTFILSAVTCGKLTVSTTASTVTGLTYGYSLSINNSVGNTATTITSPVTSGYTNEIYNLTASFTGFSSQSTIEESGNTQNGCKITRIDLTIQLGENKILVSETGPAVSGHAQAISSGFTCSNLGNTNSGKTYNGVSVYNETLSRPTNSATKTIQGVYPCFSNFVSTTSINTATIEKKLPLTTGTTFEINFGPEADGAMHAFAFPATHALSKVEIYNATAKEYQKYDGGSEVKEGSYVINIGETDYKIWKRLGSKYTESTKFKFTLNKNLNTK